MEGGQGLQRVSTMLHGGAFGPKGSRDSTDPLGNDFKDFFALFVFASPAGTLKRCRPADGVMFLLPFFTLRAAVYTVNLLRILKMPSAGATPAHAFHQSLYT